VASRTTGFVNVRRSLRLISISGDEIPPFLAGTGLGIPSDPGHYSMHPFPGLAAEINVVRIPRR
jgi:hypothetical protein